MFNHRIRLSEEIKQIRKDALTWLPEPPTTSHPSFIRQDNDGEMKGFPRDGQMWRRKEEKPENEAERRLPYSNSPLRVYPPHFLQLNFGAVAGRAEGENARLNRAGREGAQTSPLTRRPYGGSGDARTQPVLGAVFTPVARPWTPGLRLGMGPWLPAVCCGAGGRPGDPGNTRAGQSDQDAGGIPGGGS